MMSPQQHNTTKKKKKQLDNILHNRTFKNDEK